jgi:TolB-like protein
LDTSRHNLFDAQTLPGTIGTRYASRKPLERSVREKRRPGEIASRRRFGAKSLRLIAFVALTVLTPLAAQEAPNTVNTASSEPSQPQIRPEATASTAAPADTIPRKVLVLDFVNQARDAKSDYLSVSVAEALLDPLKKTGKFYLLPRGEGRGGSTATFNETEAVARGKAAGADVVVIGNFVAVDDEVLIQTKAIDVHTGQIAVAKTANGKLDASVFDLIQKLADDMSTAMASALPPIPKQVVVTERVGFGLYAKDFQAHLFVGGGLPLGKPHSYLNPTFGALGDFKFEFLHPYLNPYFTFATTHSAGKKNVESMLIFTALGGVAYTFPIELKLPLVRSLAVTPFFALGASFGTIRAAPDLEVQSFSYNVFTLSTGATLDANITDKISAAFTLRGNYLAESQTPLPVIYIMLGVGYRI